MYPIDPEYFQTNILPTLNHVTLEATRPTCNFENQIDDCDGCRFCTGTYTQCWLYLNNPSYVTFLQTHFPELII